jgi:hypothetical protein
MLVDALGVLTTSTSISLQNDPILLFRILADEVGTKNMPFHG